jgi:hypothetical protein
MATLERSPPAVEPAPGSSRRRRARPSAPAALAAGLLVLATYAAFAHGAISTPAEPRLQVAVAVLTAAAAVGCVWLGSLRFAAPRPAVAGLALLAGFAAWSGLTLAWSVAPDLTWIEFNRQLTYVLVVGLGIVLGASSRKAVPIVLGGFLALTLLVTVYALGQKLLPGVHVAGLINLDQTTNFARLQEPIGYWNALALLLAMGAPVALAVAAASRVDGRLRLAAVVALQLILVAATFTYSRGGLFALAAGLIACIALGGARLRVLLWAAAAGLAGLPPLVLGLVSRPLSANGVPLGQRESAGLLLLIVLVCCSVVLVLGAERLIALEQTVRIPGEARRRIVRALLIAGGAVVVFAVVAVAASSRGLTGSISHVWQSFTATQGISVSDPRRLLSADSANRWVWWKEAIGAFSDRPIAGWGSGSFPVLHLLYRHNSLPVTHTHSAPLAWLAETGVIGAALAIGAWGLLLRTGLRTVRRQFGPELRGFSAALLAAVLAYTVHALYDWDWDIPAVTMPALVMLGVLAGLAGRRGDRGPGRPLVLRREPGPGLRLLGLVAIAFGLCLFAVSVVLPGLASSRASDALVAAASSAPGSLTRAQDDARAATRLDPVSDAGLRASASIAIQVGALRAARGYLLQAVDRVPSDPAAWSSLVYVDLALNDYRQALVAARNTLALDPENVSYRFLATTAAVRDGVGETPPRDSPTGLQTP